MAECGGSIFKSGICGGSHLIFLSVGTQFGFDRLVKAIDEVIGKGQMKESVFAQIGPGGYVPRHMDSIISLDKEAFEKMFDSSQAVISHAGMGTISLAMKAQKPLLVMPRRRKYGEVVNDHQVDTARRFEQLGHLLAAYDEMELVGKIESLKTFPPKPRIPNRQRVINRVRGFLESL